MITKNLKRATSAIRDGKKVVIFNGDCKVLLDALPDQSIDLTLTSPPYFVGKAYDNSRELSDFEALHREVVPEVYRVTKISGNICWQVGNHVKDGMLVPLEYIIYPIFSEYQLQIRNRIVWAFGHGAHAQKRLSGRHEVIMWFSRSKESYFHLDSIRIKQKYRGKKYYKGPKKGQWSANPLGKNPGDVWSDIPNVKANHVEKTSHPCQFPIALAQRCIRAFSPPGGTIFDPFAGAGTSAIAAAIEGRRVIGAELDPDYCKVIEQRLRAYNRGDLRTRPLDKPLYEPSPGLAVAADPFIEG